VPGWAGPCRRSSRLTHSLRRMQGWGSLPDQQRRAANEQICFFGNKKDVRIGRGVACWALPCSGEKGVTSFHLFRSEGELVRDIFLGWGRWDGDVLCWKGKVRQAENLYLCQYSPVKSCSFLQAGATAKLSDAMLTIRRREQDSQRRVQPVLYRAAMAQVVPC